MADNTNTDINSGSSPTLNFDGSEGQGHELDDEGERDVGDDIGTDTGTSSNSGGPSSLNFLDCLDDTEAMITHSESLRSASFAFVATGMNLPDHYSLVPVSVTLGGSQHVDYSKWTLSFQQDAIPTYESVCRAASGNLLQTSNLQYTYTCDMTDSSKLMFYGDDGGVPAAETETQSVTIDLTISKFVTCIATTASCDGFHNIPFLITKNVLPALRLENCQHMSEQGIVQQDVSSSSPASPTTSLSTPGQDDMALSDGGFLVIVLLGLFFCLTIALLSYRMYWFHQTHQQDYDNDRARQTIASEFQMTDLHLEEDDNKNIKADGLQNSHDSVPPAQQAQTSEEEPENKDLPGIV